MGNASNPTHGPLHADAKSSSRILRDRNISLKRSEDPLGISFVQRYLDDFDIKPTAEEEKDWENDVAKCDRSNEDTSRTIIVSTIFDRHSLATSLDYLFSTQWQDMLSKNPYNHSSQITFPKPDLMIAFKPMSVLTSLEYMTLVDIIPLVIAPGRGKGRTELAFPFFCMQVYRDNNDTTAILQTVDTVTHGLGNLHRFMKAAGDEARFFAQIRFYSVIISNRSYEICVHRAVKQLNHDQGEGQGDTTSARPADSPLLSFHFDLVHVKKGRYTKAEIQTFLHAIFGYGLDVLLPILKQVAQAVLEKRKKYRSSRSVEQILPEEKEGRQ